jgi:hypothetical protein
MDIFLLSKKERIYTFFYFDKLTNISIEMMGGGSRET